jgi:hypothetical protein
VLKARPEAITSRATTAMMTLFIGSPFFVPRVSETPRTGPGPDSHFGGPADSKSSVALRPPLARGLPFRLTILRVRSFGENVKRELISGLELQKIWLTGLCGGSRSPGCKSCPLDPQCRQAVLGALSCTSPLERLRDNHHPRWTGLGVTLRRNVEERREVSGRNHDCCLALPDGDALRDAQELCTTTELNDRLQ